MALHFKVNENRGLFKRAVRIAVRWVVAIVVIGPKSMDTEIGVRFSSGGIATTSLCVTI